MATGRVGGRKPVLIQGGTGTGKTYILNHLRDSEDVLRIDGAAKSVSRDILQAGIGAFSIQLDNLDTLLTPDATDSPLVMTPLMKALERLAFGGHGQSVVFTTTITGATLSEREQMMRSLNLDARASWGARWVDVSSEFIKRLDLEEIASWPRDWEQGFRNEFESYFQSKHTNNDHPKEAISDLPAELRNDWCDVILELTGRHPAMAGGAIEFLENLLKRTEPIPPHLERLVRSARPGSRIGQDDIRTAIEDWLSRSGGPLRLLRSTVREWQSAPENSSLGRAYSCLQKIAASGKSGVSVSTSEFDYRVRGMLRLGGLCYEDPNSGKYVVPGSLLRREILGDVITQTVEADPNDPDEAGSLILYDCGTRLVVPFNRAPWKILKYLYDQRWSDAFSTLDEIQEKTTLSADRAVRNGIQRIHDKLFEARPGLEKCITNRRGEGYRFVLLTQLKQ